MNEIVFEAVKLLLMCVIMLLATKILPYFRANIESDKLDSFRTWVMDAVLYAQQILWSESGQTRKKHVVSILKKIRDEQHVNITDEQIDVLIEAAVKQMNYDEGVGYLELDRVYNLEGSKDGDEGTDK